MENLVYVCNISPSKPFELLYATVVTEWACKGEIKSLGLQNQSEFPIWIPQSSGALPGGQTVQERCLEELRAFGQISPISEPWNHHLPGASDIVKAVKARDWWEYIQHVEQVTIQAAEDKGHPSLLFLHDGSVCLWGQERWPEMTDQEDDLLSNEKDGKELSWGILGKLHDHRLRLLIAIGIFKQWSHVFKAQWLMGLPHCKL